MFLSTQSVVVRPFRRQGTIIALMALTLVALIGFLGLAIDLGMLAIAKTQAQNAADLAALTAARTLNGNPTGTYNNAAATTNAQNLLTYNYILGQTVQSSQLTLTYGSYDYSQSNQTFTANFPATSGVPYTAVAATVTANSLPGAFSRVFGSAFLPTISATAQAVHRPRDVALIMDLSGSMRFGTCLGFDFYTSSRTSNNPDSAYPTFGHYSSGSANMQGPSTNSTSAVDSYTISPSNTTVGNTSYTRTYVNNFYSSAAYAATLTRAFDSYTSTDGGNTWTAPAANVTPALPPASYTSVPGGDRPAFTKGSVVNYAQEVEDVVSGAGVTTRNQWWELDGYSGCTNGSFNNADLGTSNYANGLNATGQSLPGEFSGYTKGPGYYGKTFFIWPPDPRRPLYTGKNSAWSTAATDTSTINQFLQDFGYGSGTDLANSAFTTTTTASITNAGTSLAVNLATSFPSVPFSILVESEIMSVTAVGGVGNKTWTVTRAQQGTSAVAHNSGKTVSLMTAPPLLGIYTAANTNSSPGKTPATSQTWPWPSGDTATGATAGTLSYYLTHNVYAPVTVSGTARYLLTTDAVFQKIMRLYNWNYVIDNSGTTPCDWRIRFFGTDDNTVLFDGSGHINPPGSSGMYSALTTYNAILSWLTTSTDPFPTQLRAGRVKYYGAIPASITGSYPDYGSTDQRFWVEFINYALGYYQTSAGNYQDISAMTGYGSDFTWGSVSLNSAPSATQYMNYNDIPARPRMRYWFGPMAMVDFMQNYNLNQNISKCFFMQPGDSYEAPLYTGKEGFQAAVDTMQNNHPNDWMTLAFYSWPKTSSGDTNGRLNAVACPLGTNYAYAKSALYFPFSTINADGSCNNTEVCPYTADPNTGQIPSHNFMDIPRADGDTCFAMGLMLAYNQFAVTPTSDNTLRNFVTNSPITFPTGMAGGQGRKGAQKVIIFETDGLANCSATATLKSNGTYSYYQIRYDMNKPSSSEYPSINATSVNDPTVLSQVYSLVDQLKTDYGTTRNPFRLYTLGFGPVFSGVDASAALSTLQTMQFHAGTQASAATALPANQIITGTDANMSADMVSAFTSILQNGVQIALIK